MRRFFGEKINNDIIIKDEDFIHLTKVLRMKKGDNIICIVDDDFDYLCEIDAIAKNFCKAKIISYKKNLSLPNKNITLFQALPKKDYLDEIIAKSVELGVSKLQLFYSEYSNSKEIKLIRIKSQIITASKQCERSKLMACEKLISFNEMIKLLNQYDIIIFANEKEEKTNFFNIKNLEKAKNIAVIVGNEGGFSDKERENILTLTQNSISLGSRILRCPTAVVSILSLINLFSGN